MTPQERLEQELRNALRRQDAPPDFTERVLAQASRRPSQPGLWQRITTAMQLPSLRFATAAVLVVAAVGGSVEYRHYQQHKREGEQARQQLMLALRITGSKLQYVQAKVNETQQLGAERDRGEEHQ